MSRLPDVAAATASARSLFEPGAPVVALVSGGADSSALLVLLASGALGHLDLTVLHLDHLLRPDSGGDASHVESMCEELDVPCRIVRYDVAAYAESAGLNLEDAGRRVRYRFAEEELDALCDARHVARERGRIATGHTLDDREETLLMRLAQGAGASGLASPRHRRGRIVRPMLDCSHAEAMAFLADQGRTWREDATNSDTTRLRARIRVEVVPLMRGINPRFDDAVSRTLDVLAGEDELLSEMAQAFAAQFSERVGGEVRFDRARMLTLSRAMLRRTVREALFAAFPDSSRLEFDHIEALCDAMGIDTFARDLGDGLRAFTEYGTLIVSGDSEGDSPLAPCLLPIPGAVDLGPAGRLSAEASSPSELSSDPYSALLDQAKLRGSLTVDSVRPGDRMRPLGMTGTRKLQDLLTDAKVPRRHRARVPVVRDGAGIVWLAGVRVSEGHRIGPATGRAVLLRWTGPCGEGKAT